MELKFSETSSLLTVSSSEESTNFRFLSGGAGIVEKLSPIVTGYVVAATGAAEYTIIPNRSTAILAFIAGKFDLTFPYEVTVPLLKDARTQAPQAVCDLVSSNASTNLLVNVLEETAFFDPVNFTFPGGCHVAEVEIDPATGELALVAYTAVDDVGVVLNPMIVEGQIHGGVVQGVGQALGENCVYEPASGQLLTGSFMDYRMPRADDLPPIPVSTQSTRCQHNPLGVKGCGEVGTIASPATVMNAVVDALSPYGVTHLDLPATPQRIWQAIHSVPQRAAA